MQRKYHKENTKKKGIKITTTNIKTVAHNELFQVKRAALYANEYVCARHQAHTYMIT